MAILQLRGFLRGWWRVLSSCSFTLSGMGRRNGHFRYCTGLYMHEILSVIDQYWHGMMFT
jgi:hypothetical protein